MTAVGRRQLIQRVEKDAQRFFSAGFFQQTFTIVRQLRQFDWNGQFGHLIDVAELLADAA